MVTYQKKHEVTIDNNEVLTLHVYRGEGSAALAVALCLQVVLVPESLHITRCAKMAVKRMTEKSLKLYIGLLTVKSVQSPSLYLDGSGFRPVTHMSTVTGYVETPMGHRSNDQRL